MFKSSPISKKVDLLLLVLPLVALAFSALISYSFPYADQYEQLPQLRRLIYREYLSADWYTDVALDSWVRLPYLIVLYIPVRVFGEQTAFGVLFILTGLVYGYSTAALLYRAGAPRQVAAAASASSIVFLGAGTIGATDAICGCAVVPGTVGWALAMSALAIAFRDSNRLAVPFALAAGASAMEPLTGLFAGGLIAVYGLISRMRERRWNVTGMAIGLGFVLVWPAIIYFRNSGGGSEYVETLASFRHPHHFLLSSIQWHQPALKSLLIIAIGGAIMVIIGRIRPSIAAVTISLIALAVLGLAAVIHFGDAAIVKAIAARVGGVTSGLSGGYVFAGMLVLLLAAWAARIRFHLVIYLAAFAAAIVGVVSGWAGDAGGPDFVVKLQGMRLSAVIEPIGFAAFFWLVLKLFSGDNKRVDVWANTNPVAIFFMFIAALVLLGLAVMFPLGRLSTGDQLLAGWAKTTPEDAIFIVPTDLEWFRVEADRAIVVDTKAFPYRPIDALEWRRRIASLSEDYPFGLAAAAHKYRVTYVVARLPVDLTCTGATLVAEIGGYRVFQHPEDWQSHPVGGTENNCVIDPSGAKEPSAR